VGQHLRIQRIRLRQPSGGFGEVPDLSWIDDHDRQARCGQCAGQREFDPAGGFHDDQGRRCRRQMGEQLGDARLSVWDREPSRRALRHIQLRFRHIDPDKKKGLSHWILRGSPALHDTGLGALATVRACPVKSVTTHAVPRSRRPRLRRSITLRFSTMAS
jgi:hypothetical protein